jgi:hypothetical protein
MNHREEFRDILDRVSSTFLPRETTLIVFLAAVFLLKVTGLLSFYDKTNWVLGVLSFYLLSAVVFRKMVQRQTRAKTIVNLYFFYDIFIELLSITAIVYLAGGVEWMGSVFFLFPVVYASIVLPRKKALVVCTLTTVSYALLVILPYFGLIPFHSYFNLGFPLYQNSKYIIDNILLAGASFFGIGVAANLFTDVLKRKSVKLERTSEALEEQRATLEIKVRARTKELESLSENLKDKVEERTRELEKRKKELELKMEELEKFNSLAMGREMKMIELKKRVKELEEKLKGG